MKLLKTTNAHGIEMVEITGTKYPIRISLRKANAIITASQNDEPWVEVEKYDRVLRQIPTPNGKSFLVGDTKLDAVLANIEAIEALNTPSDTKVTAPKKTRKKKAKVVKA